MVNWSTVTSTVAEDFQHKKQFSTIDKEWDYNWPSWCSMLWLPRNCEKPWSSKSFPINEFTISYFILAVRRPNQPLSSCFYDFFVFQEAGDQPFSAARLMWNITPDVFYFKSSVSQCVARASILISMCPRRLPWLKILNKKCYIPVELVQMPAIFRSALWLVHIGSSLVNDFASGQFGLFRWLDREIDNIYKI